MNLRQAVTRNITYTIVKVTLNGETHEDIIYGKTTKAKVMKEWLKSNEEIPTIEIEEKTEKRAISINDFISHSIIINNNESEEN